MENCFWSVKLLSNSVLDFFIVKQSGTFIEIIPVGVVFGQEMPMFIYEIEFSRNNPQIYCF